MATMGLLSNLLSGKFMIPTWFKRISVRCKTNVTMESVTKTRSTFLLNSSEKMCRYSFSIMRKFHEKNRSKINLLKKRIFNKPNGQTVQSVGLQVNMLFFNNLNQCSSSFRNQFQQVNSVGIRRNINYFLIMYSL